MKKVKLHGIEVDFITTDELEPMLKNGEFFEYLFGKGSIEDEEFMRMLDQKDGEKELLLVCDDES
ncbi:MAG: hypothetical protein KDD22_05315 [Bdellovibrionales bacterium]|nr:hypothetical protein [Bdellovibrionales bacterium]